MTSTITVCIMTYFKDRHDESFLIFLDDPDNIQRTFHDTLLPSIYNLDHN